MRKPGYVAATVLAIAVLCAPGDARADWWLLPHNGGWILFEGTTEALAGLDKWFKTPGARLPRGVKVTFGGQPRPPAPVARPTGVGVFGMAQALLWSLFNPTPLANPDGAARTDKGRFSDQGTGPRVYASGHAAWICYAQYRPTVGMPSVWRQITGHPCQDGRASAQGLRRCQFEYDNNKGMRRLYPWNFVSLCQKALDNLCIGSTGLCAPAPARF